MDKSFFELASLRGRRALLTGASGNLGRIFSETLAELGADLILSDIEDRAIDLLATEIERKYDVNVDVICCDLEKEFQRSNLISEIKNNFGSLSVLVNNAAFVGTTKLEGWSVPFGEQATATWRRAFEVNLVSIFDLVRELFPMMEKSIGASVINIASIYGSHAPDWKLYEGTNISNPAAYSASKAGVIQLTRWLSTTLAPNIRVNSISPGGILLNQPEIFVKKYASKTPLGRMAHPRDLKGALGYLASDLSSYVTGHNLQVDGGWGVW